MINFETAELKNGLQLVVHQDISSPLAAVCMTYKVGTRDEDLHRTGFAHLFEHLMFGGSKNALNFDDEIQNAGGENNAFTNQDFTVYYQTLPLANLETALWLEADRMSDLLLNKKSLATQQKVVVEEFKETCLNEPYGDVWHHLSPLVYTQHPYKIPTIGLTFEHIEQASLEDVKNFFQRFYRPNNAVLSIVGNINLAIALPLVEKWFADIQEGQKLIKNYPTEPKIEQPRRLKVQANVPLDAIFISFLSASRYELNYYADDMLSDILAEGEAARLYQRLVKEQQIFTEIDAYTTETLDAGMFVIEGKIAENQTFETAEQAIWTELNALKNEKLTHHEWQKLQNRVEHNLAFGEISSVNKAINLGFYAAINDLPRINQEADFYKQINPDFLQNYAQKLFNPQNTVTLLYEKSI
jgi:zinc protease